MSQGSTRRSRPVGAARSRRWPYLLLAGLLALLGLAAACAQVATHPSGPPRLAVDRDSVDLGRHVYGERVRAEFRLTNTGSGLLKIDGEPEIETVEGC
ncbi:MAG: hypothetical protein HPY83_18790 [Anaerolineae bacterium]|nr:hypothetical protein [Anaerolineae bacterium]